jgi:hypothetical protein
MECRGMGFREYLLGFVLGWSFNVLVDVEKVVAPVVALGARIAAIIQG